MLHCYATAMRMMAAVGVGIVTVGIVAAAALSGFQEAQTPLPEWLQKENAESQEAIEAGRQMAGIVPDEELDDVTSMCSGCANQVAAANGLVLSHNRLFSDLSKAINEYHDLTNRMKLAIEEVNKEWDAVTDDVELPDETPWYNPTTWFGEKHVYDIVLPEDSEVVTNPYKVVLQEDKLGHMRELLANERALKDEMRSRRPRIYEMEKGLDKLKASYDATMAELHLCEQGPLCHSGARPGASSSSKASSPAPSPAVSSAASSLPAPAPSSVPAAPASGTDNLQFKITGITATDDAGTKIVFEPAGYVRRNGHEDLQWEWKTTGTSCGAVETHSWFNNQQNNPYAIRWVYWQCGESHPSDISVNLTVRWHDKVLAQCSYSGAASGTGPACK